jgi:filamentous hemagglutinin
MAPHDDDEDDPPILLPGPSIGPVRRRVYKRNPKHGRWDRGIISREPVNGQDALDWSVPVKTTSRVRIGIDYEDDAIVVFRRHVLGEFLDRPWDEVFHGYVVAWKGLEQDIKNALIEAGMADRRGRIL